MNLQRSYLQFKWADDFRMMSFKSSTFKLTENGENMLKRSWFVGGHFQEHLEYKCEDLGNNESKLFPLGLFLFFSFSCVVVLVEILPGEEQVFFFKTRWPEWSFPSLHTDPRSADECFSSRLFSLQLADVEGKQSGRTDGRTAGHL